MTSHSRFASASRDGSSGRSASVCRSYGAQRADPGRRASCERCASIVLLLWLVVAALFAASAGAHRSPFLWSEAKVESMLAGSRVFVRGRAVVIDRSTLTCGGEGRGWRRRGVRLYRHFDCIQPTFPPDQLAGPDLLFRVHVVAQRRYVVTDAHFAR